jgi:hypothetical protein
MFFLSSTVTVALALAFGGGVPAPTPTSSAASSNVIPFRTEAEPRIDPVFGDAAALRASIDRFLALQGEMERVRDDFGAAVHETLAALAKTPPARPACPTETAAPYVRAAAAGARYLVLGRDLQARFRDIRRADDLGDAVALTPDYRAKVKKAKDVFQQLLGDYREMRVAFYDQLGPEMRHATCKTPSSTEPPLPALDAQDAEPADDPAAARPSPTAPSAPVAAAPASAPPVWIDIDNSRCPQPTRVSIDGEPLGEVAPLRKTSFQTHAGPREICALPASDTRTCGAAGTVRKAYLHDGWSIAVHCADAGAR